MSPYQMLGWVDDVSPVSAARLNYMEQGILAASIANLDACAVRGTPGLLAGTAGVWTKINGLSVESLGDPTLVTLNGDGTFNTNKTGLWLWFLVADFHKNAGNGSGEIGVGARLVGSGTPPNQSYGYNSMTLSATIQNSVSHIGLFHLAALPNNWEIVYETESFTDAVLDFFRVIMVRLGD